VELLTNSQGEAFNVVTTITNPTQLDRDWLTSYSPHRIVQGCDRITDVVATVFPYRLAERVADRSSLYTAYLTRHARGMKWRRNRSRWGTYFERLVSFGQLQKNQLETVINKLNTWPRNTTGLVFHLSSPETDNPRTRGGPCWHFAEILWHRRDVIDMVVVYRNHDYFNKTLGNFIALGQLLHFIARQSNKAAGCLVCHSIHAYSEQSLRALSVLAHLNVSRNAKHAY